MAIEVQNGALMFAKMLLKMAGPEDVNHATYILAKALVETHEELTTSAADNERLRTDLRCAEIRAIDRGNSFAEMKAENERLRATHSPRMLELLDRVVMTSGPIAGALRASEWHELQEEAESFANAIASSRLPEVPA